MSSRLRHLVLLLTGLSLVACGNTYAGSADATIETFVPDDQPIHETHRATFEYDGREVALTHVEYGALMDCPSGCFAAHVCAIEDGEETLLFYAAWNSAPETPLGVLEECPGIDGNETWSRCEPAGLTHPVTATAEFSAFVREQVGSGPLRYCVNRYADRF
ncbi:MAG TPA: hypothetical protein RMH99_08050 [Sandaracinaceae bacterium LLY-WYZ-13_1]|nr:hypothetical protein [Sandaracinaceae bacterium LLY-WYZ-13_1]